MDIGNSVRRRRYSAKVRSGCATCKIRRVKCDEFKPSCERCTSTGRKCDGYISTVKIAQSPKLIHSPNLSSAGCSMEKNALYMFRTKIATLLACEFDFDFWTHDLLHTVDAYQTVRHAVAALAAAYDEFILSQVGTTSHRQFILDQYIKSIKSLSQCFSKVKSYTRRQQVIVLTVNLVFNALCGLQGRRSEACAHLRSGLALLHEWKLGDHIAHRPVETTPTSVNFLLAAYTRLDSQARIIITSHQKSYSTSWKSHNVTFNVCRATHGNTVTKALGRMERLYNEILQISLWSHLEVPCSTSPTRLLQGCQQQLSMWDMEFEELLDEHPMQTNQFSKELRVRRILADANIELALRVENNVSRRLEWQCHNLLQLACLMIQDLGLQEGKVSFSPSGIVIDTLYFIANHCPTSSLRNEAIYVLRKYPLIEGLWSSDTAAEIAAAKLKLY